MVLQHAAHRQQPAGGRGSSALRHARHDRHRLSPRRRSGRDHHRNGRDHGDDHGDRWEGDRTVRSVAAPGGRRARAPLRAGEVAPDRQSLDVRAVVERLADRHARLRGCDDGDPVDRGRADSRTARAADSDRRVDARDRVDRVVRPLLARSRYSRLLARRLAHRRMAGRASGRGLRHDAVGDVVDHRARSCDRAQRAEGTSRR